MRNNEEHRDDSLESPDEVAATSESSRGHRETAKPAPGRASRLERLRLPAMIVLTLVAIFAILQFFGVENDPTADTAADAPAQSVGTSTPPVMSLPPVVPAPTTAPPVTTQPPTPTTVPAPTAPAPTTTIGPPPTAPPLFIVPVGDAVPIEDMRLSVIGIGSLRFGGRADRVLGRLAASFGQPDLDSALIFGSDDRCPEGTAREVQWGPLTAIMRLDSDGVETFHSFRVDIRDPDVAGPAADLLTLSGLKAGDTVETLEEIYASGFALTYTLDEVEGDRFELRSRQGFLLWGPVTSRDPDGVVLGIFSADAC